MNNPHSSSPSGFYENKGRATAVSSTTPPPAQSSSAAPYSSSPGSTTRSVSPTINNFTLPLDIFIIYNLTIALLCSAARLNDGLKMMAERLRGGNVCVGEGGVFPTFFLSGRASNFGFWIAIIGVVFAVRSRERDSPNTPFTIFCQHDSLDLSSPPTILCHMGKPSVVNCGGGSRRSRRL
ncbi:unnamed protein product [Linum trigynum]